MSDGSNNQPISEAFSEIANLAMRLGVTNINQREGCWEHRIDDKWWIAINGHPEPVRCSKGAEVPAYNAYVEFNGWPVGLINPYGGALVRCTDDAEGDLINALKLAEVAEGSGR